MIALYIIAVMTLAIVAAIGIWIAMIGMTNYYRLKAITKKRQKDGDYEKALRELDEEFPGAR